MTAIERSNDTHALSILGLNQAPVAGSIPLDLVINVFVKVHPHTEVYTRVYRDTMQEDRSGRRIEVSSRRPEAHDILNFQQQFQEAVHAGWNNKLWLGPTPRRPGIHGIKCGVSLRFVTQQSLAHLTVLMLHWPVNTATREPFRDFREWARLGGLPNSAEVDMVIGYHPQHSLTETLAYRRTPSDRAREETFHQNTVAHEFGHYLGLAHRCVGVGAPNDPAEYCGGRTYDEQNDMMSVGNVVHPPHAFPWKARLAHHHRYGLEVAWMAYTHPPP